MTTSVMVAALQRAVPASAKNRLAPHATALASVLEASGTTDRAIVAALLATVVFETGWFARLEEPDAAAERYEGRAALGNSKVGDGKRFKGRGYVALTGRANYDRAGKALGVDLVAAPEMAAQPEVAARVAMWFFAERKEQLGPLLASDDLAGVRRLLAGGVTGLDTFGELYSQFLTVLPVLPSEYRVFMQFAGSLNRQRDMVPVTLALREEGWDVQDANRGGERIASAAGKNEVRYRALRDRQPAEELARQITSRDPMRQPVRAARNPDIRPKVLEVWISR